MTNNILEITIDNMPAKSYRKTHTGKYESFISNGSSTKMLGTYNTKEEAELAAKKYRKARLTEQITKDGNNVSDGRLCKDHYIAYPSGDIYNLHGHKMEGAVGRDGYRHVILNRTNCDVHRIIGELFIPNPDNLEQINHIDGNKLNNSVENLEWCSRSYNLKHAYANGLEKKQCGEHHHNHKLTQEDVQYIRQVYKKKDKDFGAIALARKFGIDRTTIFDIVSNNTWR